MSFPVTNIGAAQLREWLKRNRWIGVGADTQLHVGPAFVYSVAIHSDGNGDADGRVYDQAGSVEGNDFLQLYCGDESTYQRDFNPPLYFAKGIKVDIGTNAERIEVHYRPENL